MNLVVCNGFRNRGADARDSGPAQKSVHTLGLTVYLDLSEASRLVMRACLFAVR